MPTPPSVSPVDEPTVCLSINQEWVSYVLGLLWRAEREGYWDSDELTGIDGIQEIASNLVNGNCPVSDLVKIGDTYVHDGLTSQIAIELPPEITDYYAIKIVARLRTLRAATGDTILLRLNQDVTNTNYRSSSGNIREADTVVVGESLSGANNTGFHIVNGATAASSPSGSFSQLEIDIISPASGRIRNMKYNGWAMLNNVTQFVQALIGGGVWLNTADDIDEISFLSFNDAGLVAGCEVSVYGLR